MSDLVLKHLGKVVKGDNEEHPYYVKLDDLPFFNTYLGTMINVPVEIIIQPVTEGVTLDQFGYFHGGILPAALESEQFGGWTKGELEEYLDKKFLGIKAIQNDEEVLFIPSKANIPKPVMSKYISDILAYFATEGIYIPESNKFAYKKYYEQKKFTSKKS